MANKVKCTECGFVGEPEEFVWDKDFLEVYFVTSCPKCDNIQDAENATIRRVGGIRPFMFVRKPPVDDNKLAQAIFYKTEAS